MVFLSMPGHAHVFACVPAVLEWVRMRAQACLRLWVAVVVARSMRRVACDVLMRTVLLLATIMVPGVAPQAAKQAQALVAECSQSYTTGVWQGLCPLV